MSAGGVGVAVSGGADSVLLLLEALDRCGGDPARLLCLHVDHGARGSESAGDRRFVEALCASRGIPFRCLRASLPTAGGKGPFPSGFEARAREERYRLLEAAAIEEGLSRVLLGHTRDDQAETVLMRLLEGKGVDGVKGIPGRRAPLFERPLLGRSRAGIEAELLRRGQPWRTDRSNFHLAFERNWLRHVLLPVLRGRYGDGTDERLAALAERLSEVDGYLSRQGGEWIEAHRRKGDAPAPEVVLPRPPFGHLPTLLRVRILQAVLRELGGKEPGERLLLSLDALVRSGAPSASLDAGSGRVAENRYGLVRFRRDPAGFRRRRVPPPPGGDERPDVTLPVPGAASWSRHVPVRVEAFLAEGGDPLPGGRGEGPGPPEDREVLLDARRLVLPLRLSPVLPGDRLLLPGGGGSRKAQDLFTDRKVPREERWGRGCVRDGEGRILWVPGVGRSGTAAPPPGTTPLVRLRAAFPDDVVE